MVRHILRPVLAATFLFACSCLPHGEFNNNNYQYQNGQQRSSWPRLPRGHSRPWPARPHFQPPATVVDRIGGFDAGRVSSDVAPVQTNAAAKGTCVDGGREYKEGDRWTPPDRCARHSCAKGGNVAVLGCPPVAVTENCLPADEDLRQPWPLCCAVPACTKRSKQ